MGSSANVGPGDAFEALPQECVVLNANFDIVAVNEAWRNFGQENGLTHPGWCVGTNYLEVCENARGENATEAPQASRGLQSVMLGRQKYFQFVYPCHSSEENRWFRASIRGIVNGHTKGLIVAHENITQDILIEEGLKASERHFRTIVEASQEGICLLDSSGTIFFVNGRFTEIAGADLLQRPWRDALDPRSHQYAAERIGEIAKGVKNSFELKLRRPDNSSVWTFIGGSPLFDQAGEFYAALLMVSDVTEHKLAEDAVRASEEQYRLLADNVTDIVSLHDCRGHVLFVSPSVERTTGWRVDEIVGFRNRHLAHPDDQHLLGKDFLLQLLDNGIAVAEWRCLCRDGSYRWMESKVRTVKRAVGLKEQLVCATRDIEDRKRAEEELRNSRERYLLAVQSSQIGVWEYDVAGRLLFVAPNIRAGLGYTQQEIGEDPREWLERIHSDDRNLVRRLLVRHLRGQTSEFRVEHRLRHRNGSYRWYLAIGQAERTGRNRVRRILGTGTDITYRKNAELAVQEASRMEAAATLAGGVAHSINNLMAVVLGNASLLLEDHGNEPEMSAMLGAVAEAAQSAGQLAQKLLAFARGGKYLPRVLDFNAVVADNIEIQRRMLPDHVEIVAELSESPLNVQADQHQMEQAVANLISNAVEAIGDNPGSVVCRTRAVCLTKQARTQHPHLKGETQAVLTVEDSGCGMTQEQLVRVFEPFYTTKFQGRGLGLAAVYGIAKNHGGLVAATSSPGKGSIFELYLPMTDTLVLSAPEAKKDTGGSRWARVLVIDDQPEFLEAARTYLQRRGYGVLSASDGEAALALARGQHQIDIVLLDLGLPGMTGQEVFYLLRELMPHAQIILCTGYGHDMDTDPLLKAGAFDLIQKPVPMTVLSQLIENALQQD